MPICDYCGQRMPESRGRFEERQTGRIAAGYNLSLGTSGKRTRKGISRTGSRKTYRQVFVCYGCKPPSKSFDWGPFGTFIGWVLKIFVGLIVLAFIVGSLSTPKENSEAVDTPVKQTYPEPTRPVVEQDSKFKPTDTNSSPYEKPKQAVLTEQPSEIEDLPPLISDESSAT